MSDADGRAHTVEVPLEVRYAETDQMGIVHHAVYPVWFEVARTRLCETTGIHYAAIEAGGHRLVVTGLEASYRRPARYGETVRVGCRVERMGSRVLSFAYTVDGEEGRLATGTTHHVWVEAASGRPCRIPEELREPFAAVAGGGG